MPNVADDGDSMSPAGVDKVKEAEAWQRQEWVIIGDGHGVKPAKVISYNDHYSSSKAGQPLAAVEALDICYQDIINGKVVQEHTSELTRSDQVL